MAMTKVKVDGILSASHMAMLEKRGLDVDLLVDLGLYSKKGGQGGSIEALCIPYVRHGQVIHHKYVTHKPDGSKDRLWQDKDSTKSLYNEDVLRDEEMVGCPLIITEGEHDAHAVLTAALKDVTWDWSTPDGELRKAPLGKVVSVPDGAPPEPILDPKAKNYNPETPKYSYLDFEGSKDLLGSVRCPEIILAVDGDEKGANLLHDLSMLFGRARCRWVRYPLLPSDKLKREHGRDRCKDLNEVLLYLGIPAVRACIEQAQFIKVEGFYRMSELPPPPTPTVFDIQVPHLRDNYRMRLGDLCITTGIPSHGKTTVVHDIVCRVVAGYRVNAGFASFEQHPQTDFKRNLRWWALGKNPAVATPEELMKADRWIDAFFTFIVPDDEVDVNLEWMLGVIEAMVRQNGVKIVVVDPWNEMDHNPDYQENVTTYTNRAIKAFRRLGRRLNVHVIIVAHPTKMKKGADGEFQVPTLYDIADSAAWYNKADVGIVVHRFGDRTLIDMVKSKYHDDIGPPGAIEAKFNLATRRFDVIGRPPP